MASISIDRVAKVYPGGVRAVDGVSLEIADGEFTVLVGPSGCGKSTMLRMIAGLESISEGTVSIGDRVVNDVHPKDRDIAMVFQNYALYPHMSVYKNMAFALKLRKLPKNEIDRRVREVAEMLELTPLLDRKPGALSGGQRQRVAVGRAVVREPSAYLFDEPLSNLDAKLRNTTRAELKQLHHRLNTTTIYVTHDQEEAMTLGDRIVVMRAGTIQQVGTPLEVYDTPANLFVAQFIGMPPMNTLEMTVSNRDGSAWVSRPEAGVELRTDRSFESLGVTENERVVLGLRPQFLEEAEAGDGSTSFDATVQVVETLGDLMDVFVLLADGSRIVARIRSRPGIVSGDRIRLTIRPEALHLFQYDGQQLRLGAGSPVPA